MHGDIAKVFDKICSDEKISNDVAKMIAEEVERLAFSNESHYMKYYYIYVDYEMRFKTKQYVLMKKSYKNL